MAWRWWPFGDRASTPAPAGGDHGRVARRDWATLPSIQRVVGPTRLTAESVTFARTLPGHRPLEVAIDSLGHLRSPEAPAGLLVARATATSYRAPSSGLLELLRPRSWLQPAGPQAAETEAEVSLGPDPATGPPMEAEIPAPDPAPPVAMRMARVVPVQEARSPTIPSLTQALAAELARPPASAVPQPSRPVEQTPAPPSAPEARPAEPRLNLGQSRRLGLGASLSPALPFVQPRIVQPRTAAAGPGSPEGPSSDPSPADTSATPAAPGVVDPGAPTPEGPTLQRSSREEGGGVPGDQSPPTRGTVTASTAQARTAPILARPREVPSSSTEPPIAPTAPAPSREGRQPVSPPSPRVTKPIVRVQRRVTDVPAPSIMQVPAMLAGERPGAGAGPSAPLSSGTPPPIEGGGRPVPGEGPPTGEITSRPAGDRDDAGPAPSELPGTASGQPMVSRMTASETTAPAAGVVVTGPGTGADEGGPAPSGLPAGGVPRPLVFRVTTAEASTSSPGGVITGPAGGREEGATAPSGSGTGVPRPGGGATTAPIGREPEARPVSSASQPLVFRATTPGAGIPSVTQGAAASPGAERPGEPDLAVASLDEVVEPAGARTLARRMADAPQLESAGLPPVEPSPPLRMTRPDAGAERVRPLTGLVAPLVAPATGRRPLAIQAQRADAPAVQAASVAMPPASGATGEPPGVRGRTAAGERRRARLRDAGAPVCRALHGPGHEPARCAGPADRARHAHPGVTFSSNHGAGGDHGAEGRGHRPCAPRGRGERARFGSAGRGNRGRGGGHEIPAGAPGHRLAGAGGG